MEVVDDERQITLPSNADMVLHPQNDASNYTTKLCYPLNLQGGWKVGLVDIIYPLDWTNAPADTTIGFMMLMPSKYKKDIVHGEPGYQEYSQYLNPEFTEFSSNMMNFMADRVSNESLEVPGSINLEDLGEIGGPFYMRCAKLSKFYFRSAAEVCDEIAKIYNTLFAKVTGSKAVIPSATASYNVKNKTSAFSFKYLFKLEIWVNNPEFMAMGGFSNAKVYQKGGKNVIWVYTAPFTFMKRPYVETIDSLFIYTDITKNQLVGDTQVPLLGVARVNNDGYWAFNPPFYIPLNKTIIDTIHITICNQRGEKVKFPKGTHVISRLHFKRVNTMF